MKVRKFTIVNLEIRKLDWIDYLILIILLIVEAGRHYLDYSSNIEMHIFLYDLGFAFLIYFFTISPVSYRFTSFYFSAAWLLLTIVYIFPGNRMLSYVALLLFLLFHFIRFFFRRKYKREFIPPSLGRGNYIEIYNKIEGLSSRKEDAKYLRIIAYIGVLILLLCVWFSGKSLHGTFPPLQAL